MAFDEGKVNWTSEEMDMAKHADAIYEAVADVAADGFQLTDLAQIPAAVPHVMALYGYLAKGSKAEYASRLAAVGMMLMRDNDWLGGGD